MEQELILPDVKSIAKNDAEDQAVTEEPNPSKGDTDTIQIEETIAPSTLAGVQLLAHLYAYSEGLETTSQELSGNIRHGDHPNGLLGDIADISPEAETAIKLLRHVLPDIIPAFPGSDDTSLKIGFQQTDQDVNDSSVLEIAATFNTSHAAVSASFTETKDSLGAFRDASALLIETSMGLHSDDPQTVEAARSLIEQVVTLTGSGASSLDPDMAEMYTALNGLATSLLSTAE